MRFQGKIYRTLNPIYAKHPFSGQGAALHGGRFNPKGTPALYTSLSVTTAIKEANQAGALQPTMLVCYHADIGNVFDSRDEPALNDLGMSAAALADAAWRDRMKSGGTAPTQSFAQGLILRGFHGMLVRSFAPGATKDDLNLVLWRWGDALPSRLQLIDDEGRLLTAP